MYSNYTAFAQSLRAKSAFPYSQFPSSDQEFLQNPYCNPNPNPRLLQSNGSFSRQSALLYLTPSRTFLTAAATYLATTRRTQAKLPHCTVSSSSTSCCVSVQEIRSCHCHSFPVGYRDGRSCHNGGGRKLLEREVRQVWRCNGDYECHCDKTELIETDRFRRREIYHEPRVSGNHRIDQYYDYWEFDDLRQNDDNFRVCDRRRRDTHVYEDHDRIRDSDRRRRDDYDYENDYRRRRDDRFRILGRKEREEYDDYLRRRNGDIGVRVLDRKRRDDYDYDEDNVVRKGDKIRVSDRKRRNVYDERDDDNLRVSDRRRRNEYYDYNEEDKVRASDRRSREEYGGRDNKIRVSDRRRKDEHYDYDEDDKIRVSDRRKREEYDEREDKIRVSDRRGREEYDERDDKIRVSDRRKKEMYYDYDEEDKIRVSDRRKKDIYFDYDEEDKIRVSDRRRREEYDERDEKIRVSDRRRKDEYYDYNKEDKIGVSDRRKRDEYDERDDKIRISDRRRKEEYHDYDEEDKIRVSDRRRRDAYNGRDDDIRVSDHRKRDENYDYHDEDKMRILDRKRKELYKENNDKIRVSDRKRSDEYYDYDERDKIRVSDKGGREEYNQRNDQIRVSDRRRNEGYYDYNKDDHSMRRQDKIRVSNQRDDQIRVSDRTRREEADDYEEIFNAQEMNDAIRVSEQRKNEEHDKYENDDTIKVSNLHRDEEASTSRIKYRDERENYNWRGSKEGSQSIKIIAEDNSSLVSRNNTNVVNQVKVSDNQLNTANTTQIDNQSKIHDASTSVQNQVQVTRDKRNISNQFAFNETELDLQNRISVDLQRKNVDSSSSVQNLTEIARDRKNLVNQINVNETELDIQNRNRIEMERKRFDTSTSVQNLTEIKRDKKNVLNQTNVNETELDIQNRNRTERERRRADTSTSIQNLTEMTTDKKNVVNQININETELDIQNRNRIETERRRIDTATSVQNLTEIKRDRRNIINQVNIHETEENVINNTNINLTRVRRNDTNTLTQGVENPTLTSGSHQTSLESASRIEKSGSYHVSGFVDSVHQEFIDQSQLKNPSKSTASTSAGTGTGTEAGTETRISRKQNKSLWGFVADIVKLGFLKDESEKLKSGKRSSSSESRGTDDWFSGPEEFDNDSKTKEEKEKETEKEVELPIMPLSEAGPSVPVNVQEIGPSLEENIVLEEIRSEDSSSNVISGERIVREELPKVARYIGENEWLNRKKDIIKKPASSGFPGGINITGTISGTGGTASVLEAGASGEKIVMEELPKVAKYIGENEGLYRKKDVIERPAIGGSTGGINITGTISAISGTTDTGLMLEMASASGDKRTEEIKRGKQLKRITQVPKKSIDEWEDQYSKESESSGGIRITDVSNSIDDVITNVNLSGNNESEEDQQGLNLTRRKQFKRISQVPKSSFDEWEKEEETHVRESETTGTSSETHVRESETTGTSSTTIITELPKTGTLEAHAGTASGKHLRRSSQVPRGSFEEWEESYLKEKEQRRLDEFFMREALVEAERAAEFWEVPVGAVLVRNGEIVARGCNLVEDTRDSTAHAEMICIREASNNLRSWRLSDTTLYVTLEPCAMCAGAILQARIDTIVWGAPNKLLGADGSWVRLFPGDTGSSSNASALEPPVQQTGPVHPFHPKIAIRRGVLETECSEIMQQFFQLRRRKKKNSKVPESSGSKTNPPCLPAVPAHPIKLFSKMQNLFTGMFCV